MIELPDKRYSVIYCDPPWTHSDTASAGKRGAGFKYELMDLKAIMAMPVHRIAAPDCLLAMWWVAPMPLEALMVVKAWGFTFKTMKGFTWKKIKPSGKEHLGMGNWTRANTEDCLFAVRGKPKRINASVRQFIEAPIGRHSEKPAEVRDRLVQLMGDVPRIELFARDRFEGWDMFGNEVNSDIEL